MSDSLFWTLFENRRYLPTKALVKLRFFDREFFIESAKTGDHVATLDESSTLNPDSKELYDYLMRLGKAAQQEHREAKRRKDQITEQRLEALLLDIRNAKE